MSTITSIHMFLLFLKDRRTATDTPAHRALERSLATWLAYDRCLCLILKRYHATHTAYHRALAAQERVPLEALARQLQDEGNSFYTFAKAGLESIADTVQRYVGLGWPRSEATHARLTREMHAICTAQGLVLVPATLPTLMRALYACSVESHTDLACLSDADRLTACLATMEAYIAAVLQFFTVNANKSPLLHHTAADGQ